MKARKQTKGVVPKRLSRSHQQVLVEGIASGLDHADKLIQATRLHREISPLVLQAVLRELSIEVSAALGQAKLLAEHR